MVAKSIPWRKLLTTEPVMTVITLWLVLGSIAFFQAPYPSNFLIVALGCFSVLGSVTGPNYLTYVHARFVNDLQSGLQDYTEELKSDSTSIAPLSRELLAYAPDWKMATVTDVAVAHGVAFVVGLTSFFIPVLLVPILVVIAFNAYLDSQTQFLSHRLNWLAVLLAAYYAIVSGDTLFHFYIGLACYGLFAGMHWLNNRSIGGGDSLLLVAVGLTLAKLQIPFYLITLGVLASLCFLVLRIIPLRRFKDLPPLAFGPCIVGAFILVHLAWPYMQ